MARPASLWLIDHVGDAPRTVLCPSELGDRVITLRTAGDNQRVVQCKNGKLTYKIGYENFPRFQLVRLVRVVWEGNHGRSIEQIGDIALCSGNDTNAGTEVLRNKKTV